MKMVSSLRERLAGSGVSESNPPPAADGDSGGSESAGIPFDGYDRLDDRDVINELSNHTQVELEAVETYERSNKNRVPVLDKLRFMRGSEPFPGYDALPSKEVVSALDEADMTTIKKVRAYERKFANRHDVVEKVAEVHHERQAEKPATNRARIKADQMSAKPSAPAHP